MKKTWSVKIHTCEPDKTTVTVVDSGLTWQEAKELRRKTIGGEIFPD